MRYGRIAGPLVSIPGHKRVDRHRTQGCPPGRKIVQCTSLLLLLRTGGAPRHRRSRNGATAHLAAQSIPLIPLPVRLIIIHSHSHSIPPCRSLPLPCPHPSLNLYRASILTGPLSFLVSSFHSTAAAQLLSSSAADPISQPGQVLDHRPFNLEEICPASLSLPVPPKHP